MCTYLVNEIVGKIDEQKALFSDKSVWVFMREYEKLKNREKSLKKAGFSSELLNKGSGYRKIIKQFAKRMVDPDFKSQFSATRNSFFSYKPKPGADGKSHNVEDEAESLLIEINKRDSKGDEIPGQSPDTDFIMMDKSPNLTGVSEQAVLSSVINGILANSVSLFVRHSDANGLDISTIVDQKWIDRYIKSCELLFSVQYEKDHVLP